MLRIASDGKVGINVTAPDANLHIDASAGGPGVLVGNASSSEGDFAVTSGEQIQIGHWDTSTNTYTNRLNINAAGTTFRIIPAETRIEDGTAASPAICFNSDQDTGFFRPTTNAFSIATEGAEVFRLDDDKRLAIGDFSDGVVNDRNATLYVKADSTRKGLAIRTAGSGTDVVELWSNKIAGSDGTDDDSVHLMAFRVGSGSGLKGSIYYNENTGQTQFSSGSSDRRLKENIVDIDFQVVWNVNDPARFLFNLREPQATIRAVSESAMREIIAQSDLAPILNRDRAAISDSLELLIQNTLAVSYTHLTLPTNREV